VDNKTKNPAVVWVLALIAVCAWWEVCGLFGVNGLLRMALMAVIILAVYKELSGGNK